MPRLPLVRLADSALRVVAIVAAAAANVGAAEVSDVSHLAGYVGPWSGHVLTLPP